MEKRNMNVIFTKGGSGSVTTKLAIPKSWVDQMGVTPDEREVIIEFDGKWITVRKMNESDKLMERIDQEIEKKMMDTGRMGSETVTVEIHLSNEEKEMFRDIEKYDSEHYFWEFNDNELNISYTEEV